MTGLAVSIFLGETLMGTLIFLAFAGLVKFFAEREEAAEQPVAEKPAAKPAARRPAKLNV